MITIDEFKNKITKKSRLLGLDLGSKRIGVAICDDCQSIATPFKTINKGISMVNAGGTVYVMDGIYQNENYGAVDISTNTNMNNPHVVNINK